MGAATTGGTVTATLLSGGSTIDDATQTVTVKIRPSIAFSGLEDMLNVGFSDDFTVIASNLDSSKTYTIRLTTDNTNIGFIDDCTDQQEDPAVPSSITSHTTSTITLYGCATTGGTVTATLSSGGNSSDHRHPNRNGPARLHPADRAIRFLRCLQSWSGTLTVRSQRGATGSVEEL